MELKIQALFVEYFKVYFDVYLVGSDVEIRSVNWPSLCFLFVRNHTWNILFSLRRH